MLRLLGALALLTPLLAVDAAAQTSPIAVVLASTAPAYRTGQVLSDARVEIPEGASVSFLLPTGQTVNRKGPFSGVVAAENASAGSTFKDVFSGGTDRSDIGGTRSIGRPDPVRRPTVDVAADGVLCLIPGGAPVLPPPIDPAFQEVELIREGSGEHARLVWTSSYQSLSWPREVPLTAGNVTVVAVKSGAQRRLQIRPVKEAADETVLAVSLAVAGCDRQASALLQRLREQNVPLDIYLVSDRGRDPTYRSGEPIELTVHANRDAFLYCVMRDARGEVLPLFPPRSSQARVNAQEAVAVPAAPFALHASPQLAGTVRCIASPSDLRSRLAEVAVGGAPRPLSRSTVAAFDSMAVNHRPGEVATGEMTLRVQR